MASPTRRAILGAIASMPALAVSCTPQPAAAAQPTRFMRLYRAWQRADAINERYVAQYWEPACERWEAAVAAIPHQECPFVWVDHRDQAHRFRTDDGLERMCRKIVADFEEKADPDDLYMRAVKWRVEAADQRQRQSHELAVSTGWAEARERETRIGDRRYALEWAAIECPVNSAAELDLKIGLIKRHPDCLDDTCIDIIAADVASLAKREA